MFWLNKRVNKTGYDCMFSKDISRARLCHSTMTTCEDDKKSISTFLLRFDTQ